MNDEEYMQLAYQQACLARDMDEVPIGAIIVKDGEIIDFKYAKELEIDWKTEYFYEGIFID